MKERQSEGQSPKSEEESQEVQDQDLNTDSERAELQQRLLEGDLTPEERARFGKL
jgi:hypothetical protein